MVEPAIRIENLTKEYEMGTGNASSKLLALDNISLSVAKGEFLAFLGPSGCGKSTLLHIIDGLLSTGGRVVVNGESVSGPGLDRGMVFQEYALFPWRTVVENVAFGLEIKQVPKAARLRVAREYLALVGLDGFEDRYPSQLSGGMKQRAALARALDYDPEVLLMDEPFAALDAQTRRRMQEETARIWAATGKTVVFVTHDIGEALWLADRIGVMTRGPRACIKDIVAVTLPRPRATMTPEFVRLFNELGGLIQTEAEAMLHE